MIKWLLDNGFSKEDGGSYYKVLREYEGGRDFIMVTPELTRLIIEYNGNIVQLCDCNSISRMKIFLKLLGL